MVSNNGYFWECTIPKLDTGTENDAHVKCGKDEILAQIDAYHCKLASTKSVANREGVLVSRKFDLDKLFSCCSENSAIEVSKPQTEYGRYSSRRTRNSAPLYNLVNQKGKDDASGFNFEDGDENDDFTEIAPKKRKKAVNKAACVVIDDLETEPKVNLSTSKKTPRKETQQNNKTEGEGILKTAKRKARSVALNILTGFATGSDETAAHTTVSNGTTKNTVNGSDLAPEKQRCPMCFKSFAANKINAHAYSCMGNASGIESATNSKNEKSTVNAADRMKPSAQLVDADKPRKRKEKKTIPLNQDKPPNIEDADLDSSIDGILRPYLKNTGPQKEPFRAVGVKQNPDQNDSQEFKCFICGDHFTTELVYTKHVNRCMVENGVLES